MTAKIKSSGDTNHYKYKPKGVSAKAFERVHWPYLPLLIVVGLLLSLGGQSGALQAAVHHPKGNVLAYATSMSVGGLFNDTNTSRSANGVAPLSLNAKLNAAAQAKANDMATRNYWSHNTPEGNPPWIFVDAQGYAYQKLGENLAAGFSNEQATIDGWMNSPPHRENMLDPAFVDVGFGFANNDNYTSAGGGPMTIVVAFYGKPAGYSAPAPAPTPAPSPPPVSKPATQVSNPTPTSTPIPSPTPTPPPAANTTPAKSDTAVPSKKLQPRSKQPPANTDNPTSGITLAYKTSRAQLAFAKLPAASIATGLASAVAIIALGIWASRHLLAFRKVIVKGESFAIRHPLVDIALITIAATAYLLTQTAGLIK